MAHLQVDSFNGILDIMKDFSAQMGEMVTRMNAMAASIGDTRDAIPNYPQTAELRTDLNSSQAAVTAAIPALQQAQSALDTFTSSSGTRLDDSKDLIGAYFLNYAWYYAAALLVGVVAVMMSMLPFKACKSCYKVSLFCNVLLLAFLWVVAGFVIMPAAGLSDLCISPGPAQALVNAANEFARGSSGATLEYYLLCKDKRSPSDPSFNPPGAYGDVVTFSRESNSAMDQVFNVSAEIRNDPMLANNTNVATALNAMDGSAQSVRDTTTGIVALGSCSSIGGRVFVPVINALCEDIVGKGLVQFWTTHVSMGSFLLLLQLCGVWFCHGSRHPAETLQCPDTACKKFRRRSPQDQLNPVTGTEMPRKGI